VYRKLAAHKAMLNRGDAPSAQLFAISEEAEIRYTNCGLLYEVPAAERSNSVMSQDLASARSMSNMSMELLDRYVTCALEHSRTVFLSQKGLFVADSLLATPGAVLCISVARFKWVLARVASSGDHLCVLFGLRLSLAASFQRQESTGE
jgi:hypothetical protein